MAHVLKGVNHPFVLVIPLL